MKYNNDFRYDLKIGNEFENKLGDILNNRKIEVKTDFRALETGNLFVEVSSRGKKSGITKSESDYYAFIISMDYIIFVDKDVLKAITERFRAKRGVVRGGDKNTSEGVLVPIRSITSEVKSIKKEATK